MLRIDGDADGCSDADCTAGDREILCDVLANLPCHTDRNRGAADVGQQDRELVSTIPAGHIPAAHARLDAGSRRLEQPVGKCVPQPVVDALEAVEVDEQECKVLEVRIGRSHRVSKAIRQQEAVWQPGDGIVTGRATRSRSVARCSHERLPEAPVLRFHALLPPQCRVQPRLRPFKGINRLDE